MAGRPFISIVIPVYKVEEYLRECVDSVLAQSFSDYEVILVDDGSPDSCGQICDEYAERDPRIKVIHQSNQGISVARNTGIRAAMGEYLYFLDSDDAIEPDCLESLAAAASEGHYDIAEGGYRTSDGSEITVPQQLPTGPVESGKILEFYCRRKWTVLAWNKLVRRELVLEKELFFIPGIIYEDCAWTFALAHQAKSLYVLNRPTYIYRIRPGSIMTSTNATKSVRGNIVLLDEYVKYASKARQDVNRYSLRLIFKQRKIVERAILALYDKGGAEAYELFEAYHCTTRPPVFRAAFSLAIDPQEALLELHMFLPVKHAWWCVRVLRRRYR